MSDVIDRGLVEAGDVEVPVLVLGASITGVLVSCNWNATGEQYALWYRPDTRVRPRDYSFTLDEMDGAIGFVVNMQNSTGTAWANCQTVVERIARRKVLGEIWWRESRKHNNLAI